MLPAYKFFILYFLSVAGAEFTVWVKALYMHVCMRYEVQDSCFVINRQHVNYCSIWARHTDQNGLGSNNLLLGKNFPIYLLGQKMESDLFVYDLP